MKKIITKAYGEVEVPEDNEITFVKPLLGFEEYRFFYLLEVEDFPYFYWLQSTEEPELAFIVTNPRVFMKDYVLDIDKEDLEIINVKSLDEVEDYVIVNIPEDPAKMTMNLLGPILINKKTKEAAQFISNTDYYGTKHLLFENTPTAEGVK